LEEVAKMTRCDLFRWFVLQSICDDYEDIERITNYLDDVGPKCGLTISHDDILRALSELIELGYAKAWDLTRWPDPATAEYQGMQPREEITPLNPRFARTEEGLVFHNTSSASGPFDEEQNLREGWLAPEESFRRGVLVRLFILGSFSFRRVTHVHLGHLEMLWNPLAERYGINISRDEFIRALKELIGLGYLKATYREEYWQYKGMPPLAGIKPFGAYFWLTDAGWDFHDARRSWWPFEETYDGELELRKDWVPPDA
jgi:hypothetical protein